MYKYRINDLLSELPMKDYRKALKILPKALGISPNTFSNYRNIRISEDRDIPYQKALLLEKIFELKPGELLNFRPEYKSMKQLLKEYKE